MPSPDDILTGKRAKIAELEAALSVERAELRGMELMAEMLVETRANIERRSLAVGNLSAAAIGQAPSRSFGAGMTEAGWARAQDAYQQVIRGRQPGSISKRWRAALWRLDRMGGNFSPTDVVATVRELEKRDLRVADAKRQMESYSALGFVSIKDGVFNVTDQFRSKFADWTDGSYENEASEADAKDASDTALHAQDGGPQE